ncbi:PREDICTED: nuclear-pore anchor [Tarenaya hassleriana]|uniref:nuclear-pore anchor n=1 Tax=Tarenaya hassleriana TaxID=28532 RepID=UPI00053C3AFA|nr:PREDICTED: nuclear-pore anchor [Tarenaya hassleriana]
MPLFMPDDELSRLSSDAATVVAAKADEFIRKVYAELESVRAKADAASITAEQTCSLLEQKYLSLSQDFSSLESQNAQLQSAIDDRLAELAQAQAQKHQLHLQSIERDGEIERLNTEMSELHKSKRQLMELLEQKDAEISEKNSTIKSYLDKIVKLTDVCAVKEARLAEAEAELARSQVTCSRLSQEKELIERHNKWLDEELATKVDSYSDLRRRHSDLEAEMSAKLAEVEKKYNECSGSLNWHKDRLRELESKITSLQEELSSCKDAASVTEEQYNAELFTANKLVELYKESSEEWSRKAGELEGVIKALETRLNQVDSDYKERLEKELSARKQLEKEYDDLKQKVEKCEAEIEKTRKANELNLLPFSSLARRVDDSDTRDMIEESQMIVPKLPAGVSGTALAASLLRDGWSLAKIYEKYQEAIDALRHEQLGRKEAESVLQRVLFELEEKAGVIQEERVEYERMVEAYSLVNQKLQDSVSEQSNFEKIILELKTDLRRRERENTLAQKDVSDLQKQVTILLRECRDIQLRCGSARDDEADDPVLSDVEMDMESDADKIISEHLLTFKDINGLVEQNVKLRNLVRSLSEQIEGREMELKEAFELDLKRKMDEAASKVAAVLERAEEQGRMIESLHTSVAMYKRLYEEEQKLHSSYSHPAGVPQVQGRTDLLHLLENSQEATRKAQEKASERANSLEEDLAKARSEIIAIRSERDKLAMEANFAREKLEGIMKEVEHQREEMNNILARNIEFSQLIVGYQQKLRESSESVNATEELSRKFSMEVSFLKQEKEILSNAERRACDEVRALSERVYRLQASLDTIQSAEEVREEARANERRKQEEYIKQTEREWAEAKRELQEEKNNARNLSSDLEQTRKNAAKQVEETRKELANTLKTLSAAESRASVAEARLLDLQKIRSSDAKGLDVANSSGTPSLSNNEISVELGMAKEEIEKFKEEAEANKSHMLQYKNIAQVNEAALKQMESAHENFKLEAEKLQKSLETEVLSLKERVSELENECIRKSEEVTSAAVGKEEALASASAEIACLKEECLVKSSQIGAMEVQISALKDGLEREHEKWRAAQGNYERQVILQSETIQELTKTSQALATLQDEASELRKLADAQETENSELKAKWDAEKSMLEEQKNLAEKKYHELNEQNKLLHNRLEAMHIHSAEKDVRAGKTSSGTSDSDQLGDAGLQSVINYLRRTKEIAETEISLLKQEKLRLQSQLESATKMAESAQASLNSERASSRASLLTEEEIKSLQLQVKEMNLLRESNMQLREENKHNFEECQRMREVAQKARMECENLENLLRQRQTELDSFAKEMERLRTEKDLQEKRADELRETFKNIDVADYNRLKDEVRQLEEKLKARDAQIEDVKKLLLEKQSRISQLEQELSNYKTELNEREKRLNDAQQAQASLQSEIDKLKADFNKQKADYEKYRRSFAVAKKKLEKEKEDMSKENQTLSKQLEEIKQNKRTASDATVEQVMKEKEEKEQKIQILDNYVDKLKEKLKHRDDEMKKKDDELTKEKAERKSVEKIVEDSLTKVKKEKKKVEDELVKLERYQSALTRLSEELEKLKQAEGSLPEGTSAVQVLSGSILSDQATAFMSAVDYFESVAHSIIVNFQVSAKPTDSVADPSQGSSATAEPSTVVKASPATPSAAPMGSSQPPKASDNREKRITLPRPGTELRRPGRKIVRPQLVKPKEPQGDVEMSEAEIPGDEGKQPSSSEIESQANVSVAPTQTHACKRQAESLASEPHEITAHGETSSEIAPPVSKKSKVSEIQTESGEGQSSVVQGESLAAEPAVDESLDAAENDGEREDIEAETGEEKTEEPGELQQDNEAELQDDAGEMAEENLPEADASVEEGSKDQIETEQDNQDLMTEMDSEKEEGELDGDAAADPEGAAADISGMIRSPEIGELQPEILATPTQSPARIDSSVEEGEATLDPLIDEKNGEGDGTEDLTAAAAEGSDKSGDGNDQHAAENDPTPEVTMPATSSVTPTASTTPTPPAAIVAPSGETAEPEEAKRATSPLGSSSTIVNLSERARERSAIRQAQAGAGTGAGAGARAPLAVRARGRVRGRVSVRGGRTMRGRGQPPNQQQ